MIEGTYKSVVTTKQELEDYKIYCDVCGHKIDPDKTRQIFRVKTGHNDWGNDSCDSIEYKDVCSSECVEFVISEYLERSNNKNRGINSEYIEVRNRTLSKEYIVERTEYDYFI